MKKLVIAVVLAALMLAEPFIAPWDRLFGKTLVISSPEPKAQDELL